MPDAPEELIGPLNRVEDMLVSGEGNQHDGTIKMLKDTIVNLEKSLELKKRELVQYQARKDKSLREIVICRGKNPGALPIRALTRPDGSLWIVLGGKPEA